MPNAYLSFVLSVFHLRVQCPTIYVVMSPKSVAKHLRLRTESTSRQISQMVVFNSTSKKDKVL